MNKTGVVIVGGGWGGVVAAVAARKAGMSVRLLERTDMLLGTGLVGGIYRNNGRFTATEEILAMGGGDLYEVMQENSRHRNMAFPGHAHAGLYDVYKIEPAVRGLLERMGVEVVANASVVRADRQGGILLSISTSEGETFSADAFVDATGTSAVPANCIKHGNGCAMCILRCHSFAPRVSLTTLLGVEEWDGVKPDSSVGAMSGSCKLFKESLSEEIVRELEEKGVVVVPVPEALRGGKDKLSGKACQQYALAEFEENVVLLDTGPAKLMSPYYPLDELRRVPGFERARYEDPIAGGKGNSMRYFKFAKCAPSLLAAGMENLFVAGERAGPMVGHTEAIVTGTLAGHNAARHIGGKEALVLPDALATGDFIAFVVEQMRDPSRRGTKYTFSGSVYFERMKEKGLYTTDVGAIAARVQETGLAGVLG